MALPQDGQDANGLTKVTQIPAGKELMFIDPTTNEGGIITLEDLTKQILNGITTQAFKMDTGTQTIPAAINYLFGKCSFKSVSKTANISISGEYVYTGLSFTIPKNTLLIITTTAIFNKSKPLGISIVNSDSVYSYSTIIETSEKYPTSLTCIIDKSADDKTYYVWAKYSSAGDNTINAYGLLVK